MTSEPSVSLSFKEKTKNAVTLLIENESIHVLLGIVSNQIYLKSHEALHLKSNFYFWRKYEYIRIFGHRNPLHITFITNETLRAI